MLDIISSSTLFQQLHGKYQTLSTGDQLALKVLSAFALIMLIVFALIIPASGYQSSAENNYKTRAETLAWMQANKGAINNLSQLAVQRDPGQSLLGIANTTSKNFGLSFKRYQPEGDNGLSLWLNAASFNNIVLWLERLDKRYGISVKEISVDREELEGTVDVRLVLQG